MHHSSLSNLIIVSIVTPSSSSSFALSSISLLVIFHFFSDTLVTMELVQELVLTALIAVLFSYVVSKLVSFAMSGSDSASIEELKDVDDDVIMDELLFGEKMNVGVSASETKVEFVEETVGKVDKFEEKLHQVQEIVESMSLDQDIETELVGLREVQSEERFVEKVKEANTGDDLVEETATEPVINNDIIVQAEETNVVDTESKDSLMSDDDEWEGIEKSELGKIFGAAEKFVGSGVKDDLLRDVQMELYALHKVATEGPCRESKPYALVLSARSKWNAWQKLGNMSPDEAMEQYVTLLSERVPGWMEENYSGDDKLETKAAGEADALARPDLISFSGHHTDCTHARKLELKSGGEGGDLTGFSSLESGAK